MHVLGHLITLIVVYYIYHYFVVVCDWFDFVFIFYICLVINNVVCSFKKSRKEL